MNLRAYFNEDQIDWLKRKVLSDKIAVIRSIQQTGCGFRIAKDEADQLYEEENAKRKGIQKMNERLNQWAQKEIMRTIS